MTSNISIIIPTLNEQQLLGGLLSSLQGYPDLEIIVADGGSKDRTLDIAASFPVQTVQSRPGRGPQQNAGAQAASRPILLFLHCDCRLPAHFPEQVHAVVNRSGTAAGAFRLHIDARGTGFRLVEWGVNIRSGLLGIPYGDQAIFMKKQNFEAVGGFPDQPLLEDVALIRRLKRLGTITLAAAQVTTSPRRWQQLGILRTTLINQCILVGYTFGMSAEKLARFYRGRTKNI